MKKKVSRATILLCIVMEVAALFLLAHGIGLRALCCSRRAPASVDRSDFIGFRTGNYSRQARR